MNQRAMGIAAFWILTVWPWALPAAHAGSISFELGISTDLNLLRDPTDRRNQQAATSKTRAQMAVAHETPLVRLTNTSRDASITGLSIDLNDLDFVFDAIVIAEAPASLTAQIQSPLDSVQGGSTSAALDFSFLDRPLRPNESFAFWIDLDRASGQAGGALDFRDILWNRGGSSRADNAEIQVRFDRAGPRPVTLFEFAMANQTYGAQSDGATGQSLVFPLAYGTDAVGAFYLRQTYPVENQPLPEPGGWLLLASGAAMLSGQWYRRRRASRVGH